MSLDIMLPWSWLFGIVAFLVLMGWVWQARRAEPSSQGPQGIKARPLPNHLESFHQRRHQRPCIFKHWSLLNVKP